MPLITTPDGQVFDSDDFGSCKIEKFYGGHWYVYVELKTGKRLTISASDEENARKKAKQIRDRMTRSRGSRSSVEERAMSEKEEWISAASAVDLLGIGNRLGRRTICKRAHAGLIKARAKRLIRHDGRAEDNVDIPAEFWWAEGGEALDQTWTTGDFDTWIGNAIHLQAFGVTFRRSDIEKAKPAATTLANAVGERQKMTAVGKNVFIGHGGSLVWRELSSFLEKRLFLSVDEFNSVSVAGVTTVNRLEEMLDAAAFAFLVMTAEDELPDGKRQARLNVVHEAGLFQGSLGFKRAIILLEEGCEEFSNIHGLNQIRFPKNNIRAKFEEIRMVLEREKLVTSQPSGDKLPEHKGRFPYTHSRAPKE